MTKEAALSMTKAQQKLRELEKYLPDQQGPIYDFGRFLADRLNPQLVPQGFVMACFLAIYDLEAGVDGFTQKRITSRLVGYPPQIYQILHLFIPVIARAVFPADFAAGVEECYNETVKGS